MPVLSSVGKAVAGRVAKRGGSPVEQLTDQGQGANGLGSHSGQAQEILKPLRLGLVSLQGALLQPGGLVSPTETGAGRGDQGPVWRSVRRSVFRAFPGTGPWILAVPCRCWPPSSHETSLQDHPLLCGHRIRHQGAARGQEDQDHECEDFELGDGFPTQSRGVVQTASWTEILLVGRPLGPGRPRGRPSCFTKRRSPLRIGEARS